ncbi:MAG: YbaK/EbsC family protein [Acidobacteria bacterium]|nr:MAG: YbaK/EbsC family protein [Acidobacteriota bacterium]
MMAVQQAVRDFLENERISYATLTHQPAFTSQEEAAAAHVPGRDWAKTVVCFTENEPVLAVLPAPRVINFDKLRALAGAQAVRLASEREMAELYSDCEVGAVPPLGPLYKQRVLVDQRLARESEIVFSAGTHTDAIRISYSAFAAINHPVVGDFSELPKVGESSEDGRALWV